jgi:hypothetical protein
VAPGDPVDGIGVVRNPDAAAGQLLTESYRPGTCDQRGSLQLREPGRQLLGPVDRRLPEPLPRRRVERREGLAAPAVEDGEPRPIPTGLADPGGEGVERADAPRRQAKADAEPARGGDSDPEAGEGARPEADREQVDRLPAARRRDRPLDLGEQAGGVPGPPLRGEPQLRLVQYLAVPPGAGDGVDRRGVEADDGQGAATP